MAMATLFARHGALNTTGADKVEPHWGYMARVLPCTKDKGTCEYLDLVYGAHDLSMLYSGILWLTILGVLLAWALFRPMFRRSSPPVPAYAFADAAARDHRPSGLARLAAATAAVSRRYLLPEAARPIFGRTTCFQVAILAALVGYLTIWSFVGMTWRTWITPVAGMPGVNNTCVSLGPWADRIGVLAYALTPLSVMLSSRESVLSLITGVPYQSFNFLHRWLGYLIFVQSALHTIGWSVIEIRLYQPQPSVAEKWIKQTYMIWGVVAMALLTILVVLSTPWGIRMTGYEFFRKSHYILAMVYVGACWGHWAQLKCFMLPSLIFWFLDRGFRLARTAYLHYHHLPSGNMGFRPAHAVVTRFPDPEHGDVLRLDLENDQDPWAIGQHYYLCFTESSIWQSHPFTPLNAPVVEKGVVRHSYIMRAKGGETKKVADLAAKKLESAAPSREVSTSVVLTGAYGETIMDHVQPETNIVCVAGGTGITYVLPVLLSLARSSVSPDRKMELIWAIRHTDDADWVHEEMNTLRAARKALNLKIRVYATRDSRTQPSVSEKEPTTSVLKATGSSSSGASTSSSDAGCECGTDVPVAKIGGSEVDEERHPNLPKLINSFVDNTIRGPTTVFASGPGGMISDLRAIVAACNQGGKVWKGDQRHDVRLVCDDRLEW